MGEVIEMRPLWKRLIKIVQKEVVPAIGCTEPISLAFAAATAAERLHKPIERIAARVSANLMKNGMGVTVPGTGMTGLPIAAAVGALGGRPEYQMEVLKDVTPEIAAAGKQLLVEGRVTLSVADVPNVLYSEATVFGGGDWVRVAIADDHTNVVSIERNGEVVFSAPSVKNDDLVAAYSLAGVQAQEIYDFADRVPLGQIAFIKNAAVMNDSLASAGMGGQYGLRVGAIMQHQVEAGMLGKSLLAQVLMRTSAASDARMGGASLPAMTNSGSGNQGIAATMPVVVVAEYLKASEEQLIRALVLSHTMAILIHDKLPKLSAFCAVTTASMGAAAGMAYLFKGDFNTVSMAISNMIGDVAGVICDGASNSCAMKVSTAAAAAFKAVLMALEGTRVMGSDGIVDNDIDQSIANLGELASKGMIKTDEQILQIMLHKKAM